MMMGDTNIRGGTNTGTRFSARLSTNSSKTTCSSTNPTNNELISKKEKLKLTGAERQAIYRQKLKNQRLYDLYKKQNAIYVQKSRVNASDEQKNRTKELTRLRVQKCRGKKKAAGQPLNNPKVFTRKGKDAKREKR